MKNYSRSVILLPIVSVLIFVAIFSIIEFVFYKKEVSVANKELKLNLTNIQKSNLKNQVRLIATILSHYNTMKSKDRKIILDGIRSMNNNDEYFFLYKINKNITKAKTIVTPDIGVRKEGMILDLEDKKNIIWKQLTEKLAYNLSNDGIFKTYKFKRPSTQKIEQKISYFYFDKKNYLLMGKGVYVSYIKKLYMNINNNILNLVYKQILYSVLMLIVLLLLFSFIAYKISKKISKSIEEYQLQLEYDNRYLEYRVEKQTEEVVKKYFYCNLTGLPNRNKLMNDLKYIKSTLMIDIDDFSAINDIYGMEFGDYVLKEFALNLDSSLYNATLYRVGSDEFVVAFREVVDLRVKIIEIEKIVETFEIKKDFMSIELTTTIGGSEIEPILETADLALRFAKLNKKQYMIYSKDLKLKFKDETTLDMIKTIKYAIKDDRVVPFFQCIRDRDGNVIKYESLVRIITDDGKVISPFFFLDIAKQARMYHKITHIMIQKSLEYFKDRTELVSVNLAYEDIVNMAAQETILNMFKAYKDTDRIVVELLESESLENLELVKDFLVKLRALNIKIAIDDFGSGYSNFAYLLSLEPDYLKIDGSIVKNLDKDENARLIAKTIVDFAKAKNIKVVAEFVHNKEVYEIARDIGVDEYQGYYFCEPLQKV